MPIPVAACRKSNRGMTLVEILVAVGILSIAIIVLASLFPVAINYQKKATYERIASLDAQGTLDATMCVAYDSLDSCAITTTVPELPAGNSKTVQIRPYPTTDSKYLRLVTVRISWPGSSKAKYLAGGVVYHTLIATPSREGSMTYGDI